MPSQLLAALVGAIVAFCFTYLLQRGQFRRADLEGMRERSGIARALRTDLYSARLAVEVVQKNKVLAPGFLLLPVTGWEANGHKILAALAGATNALGDLKLGQGGEELDLNGLLEKIDRAVEVLTGLQREYREKESRVLHPVRSRIPSGWPTAIDPAEPARWSGAGQSS